MNSDKANKGCLQEEYFLNAWASANTHFHPPLRMKLMIRQTTQSTMIRTLAKVTRIYLLFKLIFGLNLKRATQTWKKVRKKYR